MAASPAPASAAGHLIAGQETTTGGQSVDRPCYLLVW